MKRKTFWKVNNSSLKDYAYVKEINEEIKNVIEEYAVMLYDRNEMHNIPISDIQFTISDQLFLDVLLMKIRSKTIGYATMKKRKTERKKRKKLEENIKPLEKKVQRTFEEKKKIRRLKV